MDRTSLPSLVCGTQPVSFRIFTDLPVIFARQPDLATDDGASLQRVRRRDQNVYRVAVQRQGMVDVTVVARIEHRGGHEAVNEQRAALFVNFVFDRICVSRDPITTSHIFRQFFTRRDVE